jgi:multicomponent Na+:H+ antiporter subunit G
MKAVGDIIILAGIAFIFFGVAGLIKYKDFYTRILVTAKIDTVGAMTIIIGVAVKHGFSFLSLKVMLLMLIMMIINPFVSHTIARSAYLSGYQARERGDGDSESYNEDHV